MRFRAGGMSVVKAVVILIIAVVLMAALDVADTVLSFSKNLMASRLGVSFNLFSISPYTMAYILLALAATATIVYIVFKFATAIREARGGG